MKNVFYLPLLCLSLTGFSQESSSAVLVPNPYGYQLNISNTLSPFSSMAFLDLFSGNKSEVGHGLNVGVTNSFPMNFITGDYYRMRLNEFGEVSVGRDLVATRLANGLIHAYGTSRQRYSYPAIITSPLFKSAIFGQSVSTEMEGGVRVSGVMGTTDGMGAANAGVTGISSTTVSVQGPAYGVFGYSNISSDIQPSVGVFGEGKNRITALDNEAYGGYFSGWGSKRSYGVFAVASGTSEYRYGIFAGVEGSGPNVRAGFFNGDVRVQGDLDVAGTISKGGGSFKIDHPTDPENKYLSHSFVESPDMMNIYNGNLTTDANGDATVTMPPYFTALNRDFRYQLTCIGTFAQAIVLQKMRDNTFKVKTDKPNVEVSWQVTGVRQDAWANAHRIPNEENKTAAERGKYLYPVENGKPKSMNVLAEAALKTSDLNPSDVNFRAVPALPAAKPIETYKRNK